jgi:hypothetical protein
MCYHVKNSAQHSVCSPSTSSASPQQRILGKSDSLERQTTQSDTPKTKICLVSNRLRIFILLKLRPNENGRRNPAGTYRHKSRNDANKENRRVGGFLPNATLWRFLFTDKPVSCEPQPTFSWERRRSSAYNLPGNLPHREKAATKHLHPRRQRRSSEAAGLNASLPPPEKSRTRSHVGSLDAELGTRPGSESAAVRQRQPAETQLASAASAAG